MSSSHSPTRIPTYKHSLRRHVPSRPLQPSPSPPESVKSSSDSTHKHRSKRERAKEAVEHVLDKLHIHHHHHDDHHHESQHASEDESKKSKRHSFLHLKGHHSRRTSSDSLSVKAKDKDVTVTAEIPTLHYGQSPLSSPMLEGDDVVKDAEHIESGLPVLGSALEFPVPMIDAPPVPILDIIVDPLDRVGGEQPAVSLPIPELTPYAETSASSSDASGAGITAPTSVQASAPGVPIIQVEPSSPVEHAASHHDNISLPAAEPPKQDDQPAIPDVSLLTETATAETQVSLPDTPTVAKSSGHEEQETGSQLHEVTASKLPSPIQATLDSPIQVDPSTLGPDSTTPSPVSQHEPSTTRILPAAAQPITAVISISGASSSSSTQQTRRPAYPHTTPLVPLYPELRQHLASLSKNKQHSTAKTKKPSWIQFIYSSFVKPVVAVARDCTVAVVSYGFAKVFEVRPNAIRERLLG